MRGLGRLGYRVLANGLCLLLRTRSDIRAAYLVGSIADDDVEPGLSDIDLVLVIADLSCRREYELTRWIEGALRYLMPPWNSYKIGRHVSIYAMREWHLLGDMLLGKKRGAPRKVFEKGDLAPRWKLDERVKALHHIYKAFWRLQGLPHAPWNTSQAKLDHRLYLRALNRTALSIASGIQELSDAPSPGERVDPVLREIEDALGAAGPKIDSAFVRVILPRILRAFDHALIRCTRKPDSSQRFETAPFDGAKGFDTTVPSPVLDCLASTGGSTGIYIATGRERSLVVIDSDASEIAGKIAVCLGSTGARPATIVTTTMLERLYLNAPMDDVSFIRHPCATSFVARGQYSPERVLIEAYSIFVQLRMGINKEQPGLHMRVRDKVERLIAHCREDARCSTGPNAVQRPVLDETEGRGGTPSEFKELFALGNDLVVEMRHRIESSQRMTASAC